MPSTGPTLLLSPAELSYLHTSLTATPPTRPDLRSATQFRPLIAETGILPATNGSARVCFGDGTEALAGVKAELERTPRGVSSASADGDDDDDDESEDEDEDVRMADSNTGNPSANADSNPHWLEVSLDLPAHRDDESLPTFLSAMLHESLLTLTPRLRLNARWHWKLYIDLVLLSAPASYPLPLLSMAAHLALANTVLPRRTSDAEDDPLFDDDWEAGRPLFGTGDTPPVTLLVVTVGENVLFDPCREEVAVAEGVVAISLAPISRAPAAPDTDESPLAVLALRTIDPPARLTPLGIPNAATNGQEGDGGAATSREEMGEAARRAVWSPPRGGIKRALLSRIVKMCVGPGGVGAEVFAGLAGVAT